jgi:chaperonin GroEL
MEQIQMPSMAQGFSPKDLCFNESAQQKLINGIDKIAQAVKSTLGPRGNTVLIESPHHTHGITVTKDGVTVAKSVDLLDPVENLAVRMMKEAADKTASIAGDGTTTAIVLTEALVKKGFGMFEANPNVNKTETLREVNKLTEKIIKSLKKMSKPVNDRRMLDVATISANNDKEIGKIIADVYKAIGESGIVTVEKSQTSETYYETTNGVKIDRGYSNPMFINNHKRDECILEDVYVLVSDAEITNILQIENVLKPIIQERKKLLIVAPVSQNVSNTLAANVLKNNLELCTISPPSFGYKQHELMNDIALSVGATYFSEKTGDDLSIISFADLGHCAKVIVGRDSTVVLKDEGEQNTAISKRVEELWVQHKETPKKADKEFILNRIASLTGGIGVIYVGGNTDLEQKELFDRVDDAVCAVRSALIEGILPGAGLALFHIAESDFCCTDKNASDANKIAHAILYYTLRSPLIQILNNAGKYVDDIYEDYDDEVTVGHGYDVKNEKYGNLMRLGVIDPMKVTKCALQNAVSVATTILSTNAIVTMARSYETSN